MSSFKWGIHNTLDGTEGALHWQDANSNEIDIEDFHPVFDNDLIAGEVEELLTDSDNNNKNNNNKALIRRKGEQPFFEVC